MGNNIGPVKWSARPPLLSTEYQRCTLMKPSQPGPTSFTREQVMAYLKRPGTIPSAPKPATIEPSGTQLTPTTSHPAPVQRPRQPAATPVPTAKPIVARTTNTDPNRPKEHSLSNTVAGRLGCPAALLLKYLDFVISKRGKEKDGRRWCRVNLDHLVERMPYLSRTCIEETLKKLTVTDQAPLLVHHKNSHGYDRTGNYSFRNTQIGPESRADVRYFLPEDAVRHGIPAALLLHNLRYWAAHKNAPKDGWLTVKVTELAKVQPLTAKQIRDALKALVNAGAIEPAKPSGKHRFWRYRLIGQQPATVTKADMQLTEPDMRVPKADMGVTNPDMQVTKADNYNSYQSSLSASLPASFQQSDNYSVRPASPTAVSGCQSLSKDQIVNANNEIVNHAALASSSKEDEAIHSPLADDPSFVNAVSSNRDLSSNPMVNDATISKDAVNSASVKIAASPDKELPAPNKPAGLMEADRSNHAPSPPVMGSSPTEVQAGSRGSVSPALVDDVNGQAMPSMWPSDYTTMRLQAYEGMKNLDPAKKAQFEAMFQKELERFLGQQTLDCLEVWMETYGHEPLYAIFLPLVASRNFPAVLTTDENLICLLRKVFMVRLIDVFGTCQKAGNTQSGQPYPYLLGLDICRKLEPRRQARADELRNQFIAERRAEWEAGRQKHLSIDEPLENDPVLSAARKVKVLENAINSRNLTGTLNAKYETKKNLLSYNGNSLRLAKEFFNINPTTTPAHLLAVMDRCAVYVADNQLSDGEFDPRYEIRKGTNLTSLIKQLPAIIAAAELGDTVPTFQPVPEADSPTE